MLVIVLGAVAFGFAKPAWAEPTTPPTLHLLFTADPPANNEGRFSAFAGAGPTGVKGQLVTGGSARGIWAIVPNLLWGLELGGGGLVNTKPADGEQKTWSGLTGRLFIGYAMWVVRSVSLAGEIGLSPSYVAKKRSWMGVDLTLAATFGTRDWALTATYRLDYTIPTQMEDTYGNTIYHLAAVTFIVPREGQFSLLFQTGIYYGDEKDSKAWSFGYLALIGVRASIFFK